MSRIAHLGAAIVLCQALAACGGAGSGSSSSLSPTGPAQNGTATVTFTIGAGGSIQSGPRGPNYISANTSTIAISVNSAPPLTFPCPRGTCTATFSAPAGNDTFAIVDADAGGNALARSTFEQNCPAGVSTTINAVLNGIVATADIDLETHDVPMGAPSTINVIVTARDVSGAVIVGPGNYQQPLTLSNSDSTGATVLSATTLTSPNNIVSLKYDGTSYVNAVITSSATTTGLPKARLTPVLAATEVAVPSGAQTEDGMALGADNALWFSEARSIGRITVGGAISEYPVSVGEWGPGVVSLGADGNIWFAGTNNNGTMPARSGNIGMVAPAGAITTYTVLSNAAIDGMKPGPDGKMWIPLGNSIGEVAADGSATVSSPSGLWGAHDFVIGPDGNVWFISNSDGTLYRYAVGTGFITSFLTPPVFPGAAAGSMLPYRIIVGPDGAFYLSSGTLVAKMDTNGKTLATYPFNNVFGIYDGQMVSAFGAVWVPLGVSSAGHPMIARITPSGQYAELALPALGSVSDGSTAAGAIALGADNALWYIRSHYVGRFVAR